MTKGKIPDGWTDYSKVGQVISGTRIVAFKCPLSEDLFAKSGLPVMERFTPDDLIATCDEKGIQLGIVIDLTNTTRYYFASDITEKEVEYKKIFIEGRNLPDEQRVREFRQVVDDYLRRHDADESVIGVHCTHGLNRTGYLVCRYMIDVLKMNANDAISAFNHSRGHSIERENYLEALKSPAARESHAPAAYRTGLHGASSFPRGYPGPMHYPPPPLSPANLYATSDWHQRFQWPQQSPWSQPPQWSHQSQWPQQPQWSQQSQWPQQSQQSWTGQRAPPPPERTRHRFRNSYPYPQDGAPNNKRSHRTGK